MTTISPSGLQVVRDSLADKAGIAPGWVIKKIDGVCLDDMEISAFVEVMLEKSATLPVDNEYWATKGEYFVTIRWRLKFFEFHSAKAVCHTLVQKLIST